ncbi:MAG: hypothetical protein LCH95_24170, partial [Proteobacteria bacterium]|nr:hypothetical protein [Pseudomonadota bacterium]
MIYNHVVASGQDVLVRIARNVRGLRVSAAISQEAWASEAEIDVTYVSAIERGVETRAWKNCSGSRWRCGVTPSSWSRRHLLGRPH